MTQVILIFYRQLTTADDATMAAMHSNMNPDHSIEQLRPPTSSLHPLLLLDEFLQSLETENESKENSDETSETRVDADKKNKATALEKQRDYVLRVADFLYGGSMLEAALAVLETDGAIRKVTSHPSQRSAFLVRGAASRQNHACTDYFCLVSKAIQYCSCRSYFERAKNDPKCLCKHLLAIKLMPSLECPCRNETIPDAEFSGYLLRRLLPRESGD